MLKEYVDRNDDGSVKPVCSVGPSQEFSHDDNPEMGVDQNDSCTTLTCLQIWMEN